MALTDPEHEDRYRRASMIIVPTDTEGYELIGNLSIMGHRGGDWASHGEVAYHGARVPVENLLGGEGMGFALAQSRLGPGRIHHCMRWIGVCERAFEIMCRHAVDRELRRANRWEPSRRSRSGSPRAGPRSTPRG